MSAAKRPLDDVPFTLTSVATARPRALDDVPFTLTSVATARAPVLTYGTTWHDDPDLLIIAGHKESLIALDTTSVFASNTSLQPLVTSLVTTSKPGDGGQLSSTLYEVRGKLCRLTVVVLPETCSRHNTPFHPHALTEHVRAATSGVAAGNISILLVLDDAAHAGGAGCAIARAFPSYSLKNIGRRPLGGGATPPPPPPPPLVDVHVAFATKDICPLVEGVKLSAVQAAADAVRLAARLVDAPPELLTTTAFVDEARACKARLEARMKSASSGGRLLLDVIVGTELRDRGYGGLWSVGKGAEEPPALVTLSYYPAGEVAKAVALVGKGIVYDTGGLALKPKLGMGGMKADCGGAAGLLAAFEAAVTIGVEWTALHLVLCLAENAIGPGAVRNDDVVHFFSGKTAEINNTDAEGRLVLADGVAHATAVPSLLPKHRPGQDNRKLDLVVDMATLTGAQMVACGHKHAAILTNSEAVEDAAVRAGKLTGDLVHPLIFCPEFHRAEFASAVADMKNDAKEPRTNALASCAGSFISEHLSPDFAGAWLHIDCAGPAFREGRGTGYGVALVLGLLEVDGFRRPAQEEE